MSLNFRKRKEIKIMSTDDFWDLDYLMEEPYDDKVLVLRAGYIDDGGAHPASHYEWIDKY